VASKLDSRLTDFDWEGRIAAPVEHLADTHTHYSGDKAKLEILASTGKNYNVELTHLIHMGGDGAQALKDISEFYRIGENCIPFFRIDMTTNDASQVQRAYDEGWWGIKCITPNHAYDDHYYDPIYAKTQELNMPLLFHVGLLGKTGKARQIGCGMSLMRADMLDTLESRFPDLLIQGAHLGNPHIADAVLACVYAPNLMWDASGGCRHLLQVDPKILAAPMNGRRELWKCITWATDTNTGVFPPEYADGWETQYEYQLAYWQDIFSRMPSPPDSEELDNFFFGNALRWADRIREKRGT